MKDHDQEARVEHSDAVGGQDLPRDTATGDVPPEEERAKARPKGILSFVVCRSCKCYIECGMCGYTCESDGLMEHEREPESMEIRFYTFSHSASYVR